MRYGALVALIVTFSLPQAAFAAGSLYLFPSSGTHAVGESFEVGVYADTDGASVTAAEGELRLNLGVLEVVSVSTAQSALTLWSTEPTASEAGAIEFSGWASQPFVAENGLLFTLTLRGRTVGEHNVQFLSGALLANDGKGSNIVSSLGSGRYSLALGTLPVGDAGGQVLGASTEDPDAPPPRPTILEYPQRAIEGDQAVIRGRALPDAKVQVSLKLDDGEERRESVRSASDGSFVFVPSEVLSAGSYALWAETYTDAGLVGPSSGVLHFTVSKDEGSPLVAAAIAFGKTPSVSTTLLLAVGFGIGYAGYLYWERRRDGRRRSPQH